MHPQIASVLAKEHQRDLAVQARRHRMAASPQGPRRHARGWGLPRYRVNWSRTTLSPAGRRERSWVLVISASRGASFPHSG